MAIGLLGMAALGGSGALGVGALGNRLTETDYGDPSQMQSPTGYDASKSAILQELVRRHNAGALDLPKEQVKQLAILAAQNGLDFRVESKPIRKMAFDLADTASFGLMPDEWRPTSVGQELFGESFMDSTAGAVGTAGGCLTGGALLGKAAMAAGRGMKGWATSKSASNAQRSYDLSKPGGLANPTSRGYNLPPGPTIGALPPGAINLGQGAPLFGRGLNRGGTPLMSILQTGF